MLRAEQNHWMIIGHDNPDWIWHCSPFA